MFSPVRMSTAWRAVRFSRFLKGERPDSLHSRICRLGAVSCMTSCIDVLIVVQHNPAAILSIECFEDSFAALEEKNHGDIVSQLQLSLPTEIKHI